MTIILRTKKLRTLYAIHMLVTREVNDLRTAEIYLNIRFKEKIL